MDADTLDFGDSPLSGLTPGNGMDDDEDTHTQNGNNTAAPSESAGAGGAGGADASKGSPTDTAAPEEEDSVMQGTDEGSADSKKNGDSPAKNGGEGEGASGEGSSAAANAPASPASEKKKLEDAAKGYLVEQTHMVVVPSYSKWFDINNIKDIEQRALPEFFNNRNRSKTPLVYKDYRDFMINTYRLNPSEYLTVTACRRNLAGDVCSIMRVHAFLEQWGLINYQIDPETRPSNIGPPFTGHFRITADTPRGLQPFQPAPGAITTPGKPHPTTERASSAGPSKAELNLEIRKNIYDASGNRVGGTQANGTSGDSEDESGKKLYNCYSCGVDCTRVRYHSARSARSQKQIELCPNCFLEGRFPATSSNTDFVRMEDPSHSTVEKDAPWTDQETLLLLEGLELYNEDWNQIADHVGNRTREQCVVRFLQLPIEDNYLEEKPEQLGPLQYNRTPFSQADNPVMSVVAFLASIVDPKVAAAAAKSSIEEMTKSLNDQIQGNKAALAKEDPKQAASETAGEKETSATNSPKPVAESSAAAASKSTDVKSEGATADETMDVDEPEAASTTAALSPSNPEIDPTDTPENIVTKVASIALGTSAARAHALASNEEREMTRLVNAVVNCSLRKLELKLTQFNELEQVLQAERREIEKGRQQLFLDRLAMKKQCVVVQDTLKRALAVGGAEGYQLAGQAAQMGGQGPKLAFEGQQQGTIPNAGMRPVSLENPGGYVGYEA
ncbi:uncharacterized protein H6S33_008954 [Morchella sextelata]|uniref:uncharacterized protein n=1 Tax=Morchella sextelata TaxID=1174677 RepID=UPI001D0392C5|nr:uncharacterized protein H6S33_008954 [Morchella sextelata]KAH0612574.1 hypothetical protein H6S33_008954 [Morchella sextelata]